MKIALLKSHFASLGGLEKYTVQIASAFVQKGVEVVLLTTASDNIPKIEGMHTVILGHRSKFSLYHLLHFDALCKTWLKHNSVDAVFGMERNTHQTHYRAGSGVHAAFLKQRKLVDPFFKRLTFSLNPLHIALLKIEKKAFEDPFLKKIFPNSEMVKKEILDFFSVPESKIEVVHNGVEWSKFASPFTAGLHKEIFQRELGLEAGCYYFLFVGNGYKRKGLSLLLRGMSLLKDKSVHLLVVGKEKNLPHYKKYAEHLGLKKRVHFFGPATNILPYYQAADALCLPTIYDPFANVTLEALAMGLFVVTSPFNGGKEVLSPLNGTIIQDIIDPESIKISLEIALSYPKREENALKIRNSIKELDFSKQLNKIIDATIQTI